MFLRMLNQVAPEAYSIHENQLISIYVYSSGQQAEKGLKDFEEKTAAATVVPHSKYRIANVLLFYVAGPALKDERVEKVAEGLLVTK
ncbi:hypothetical protein DLM86_04050 [Paenibacillus flagellatus]|uniref:Uncharacterized protein n=1 Tax=Paenibacillus flagellatus TaxID=2211139 RepID=A0A2V5KCB7_9BACL|nr:hypothetical protein DLM86_04050 [Paenibacillus flagellatus]